MKIICFPIEFRKFIRNLFLSYFSKSLIKLIKLFFFIIVIEKKNSKFTSPRYIYTGVLDLSTTTGQTLLDMIIGVNILRLEELNYHLQDYLIANHSTWIKENYIQILTRISGNKTSFDKL